MDDVSLLRQTGEVCKRRPREPRPGEVEVLSGLVHAVAGRLLGWQWLICQGEHRILIALGRCRIRQVPDEHLNAPELVRSEGLVEVQNSHEKSAPDRINPLPTIWSTTHPLSGSDIER